MAKDDKTYVGIDEDLENGMTPTARLVLDARVLGLIADDETCRGWNVQGIQSLYDRVSAAWERYGHLPSRLPDELRQKHARLFEAAIAIARQNGWDPDGELRNSE
jgi:hypothetical protein